MVFEDLAEKMRIVIANEGADLFDGNVGVLEQLTGGAQASGNDIGIGGGSESPSEYGHVAGMAQILQSRKVGDPQILLIGVVDHPQGLFQRTGECLLLDALGDANQDLLQNAGAFGSG